MKKVTCFTGSVQEMLDLGQRVGRLLRGGEILELSGDVGTGKTTLTKGVALGLAVDEVVQSPTFTISRIYEARDGLELHHYDFYRLKEAGIMRDELAESLADAQVVTVLEWDETVKDLLPEERTVRISISYTGENERSLEIEIPQGREYLLPAVKEDDK